MIQHSEIKVRGYHLDLYGHVNNARYLEFLEEGRWAFLEESHDLDALLKKKVTFAVVNININYRRAVYMNEVIVVSTAMTRLGTRSAVMRQEIRLKKDNTLVADAEVTFVVIDNATNKAITIEGEIRAALESLIAVLPAEGATS